VALVNHENLYWDSNCVPIDRKSLFTDYLACSISSWFTQIWYEAVMVRIIIFRILWSDRRRAHALDSNTVTYTQWVVWLITWRGFWLDTGFIPYGDLQLLHRLQLQWTLIALVASWIPLTELYCADVSLRGLTASTHLFCFQRLTSEADWRRLTNLD
jgi:hypothetical protein